MEEKLESQRKLAEEMKRKAEQGSMQSQGEAQELLLEDLLQTAFPFDIIEEVGKGVRGADCMLTVRNKLGQECGKIIFESKRTKDFSAGVDRKAQGRSTKPECRYCRAGYPSLPERHGPFWRKRRSLDCAVLQR
jgi:hypothetical protein